MTGHTSNEQMGLTIEGDAPQERSTDSESATRPPIPNDPAERAGVVQDSPGTTETNVTLGGNLDEQGNYRSESAVVEDRPADE